VKKPFKFFRSRFCASRLLFLLSAEPDIHLLLERHYQPPQKIELVISCQSRNNPKGASGTCAPSPNPLIARPGRPQAAARNSHTGLRSPLLPLVNTDCGYAFA
jgi:hypothetical protein